MSHLVEWLGKWLSQWVAEWMSHLARLLEKWPIQ
jgi:hypothetical protein